MARRQIVDPRLDLKARRQAEISGKYLPEPTPAFFGNKPNRNNGKHPKYCIMKFLWLVVAVVCVNSVASLECKHGFNLTIFGIPFNQWSQGSCDENSECFTQEVRSWFPHPDLKVRARYGGCVSKSYSKMLSCQTLFGEESDLDPANVFKMLPGWDAILSSIGEDIRENITEHFRNTFSDGTGLMSLVEGLYRMAGNLGVDVTAAIPLKEKLAKLIEWSLPGSRKSYWAYDIRTEWRDGKPYFTRVPAQEFPSVVSDFLNTLRQITDAYKLRYPDSKFPELAWRIAKFFNTTTYDETPRYGCYQAGGSWPNYNSTLTRLCEEQRRQRNEEHYLLGVDTFVDLQFALVSLIDRKGLNLYEEFLVAFPEYEFYIRLLQLLHSDDVKQIYKDFYALFTGPWYGPSLYYGRNAFFSTMVFALNETVAKITSKFSDFNNELRDTYSPQTCKSHFCGSDLCNSQRELTDKEEIVINPTGLQDYDDEGYNTDDSNDDDRKHRSGMPLRHPEVQSSSTTSHVNQIFVTGTIFLFGYLH